MKEELRAVLFDLDGVIVDTAKYHYHAWKRLADTEGIYFDEIINERLKGISRDASLKIVLERSSKVYSDEEKAMMADAKNKWYIEMIEKLTHDEILPGVESLSKFMHSVNVAYVKYYNLKCKRQFVFFIKKNRMC